MVDVNDGFPPRENRLKNGLRKARLRTVLKPPCAQHSSHFHDIIITIFHACLQMFISSSFNYVPSAKLGARGCPGACLPVPEGEGEYRSIPDQRV